MSTTGSSSTEMIWSKCQKPRPHAMAANQSVPFRNFCPQLFEERGFPQSFPMSTCACLDLALSHTPKTRREQKRREENGKRREVKRAKRMMVPAWDRDCSGWWVAGDYLELLPFRLGVLADIFQGVFSDPTGNLDREKSKGKKGSEQRAEG